jgi:multiple sugar transport system substrate-binding protein
MSKFQIILTSIFVIFIIAGVVAFATFKGDSTSTSLPSITIWGTFPESTFNDLVGKININRTSPLSINYFEIPSSDFRKQYIEELARGKGPDAILIAQDEILGFSDKIIEIPNTVLTQRDFQNTYIPQADLYITNTGIRAIPFIVDPMVMYWNRTILTNAGIAKYPAYWDDFSNLIARINQKDQNSNIRRSAIAMGEFRNINHAREILSTLFLQKGNPVTYNDGESIVSALGDSQFTGTKTSSPALAFYVQFSNPLGQYYSWNRSLPSSKNSFLSGNLATYFGFASEIGELREKNPNIDYDVAPMPQWKGKNGENRATFGKMYGLSISRSSKDQNSTYQIIKILTSTEALSLLSKETYLPSVRRDAVASGSTDPYMSIFLDSALISKGWLDTSAQKSNTIFTDLVESVTSGRSSLYNALNQASEELNITLKSQ